MAQKKNNRQQSPQQENNNKQLTTTGLGSLNPFIPPSLQLQPKPTRNIPPPDDPAGPPNEALVIQDLESQLQQFPPITAESTISKEEVENLIQEAIKQYNVPFAIAYAAICCTLQAGGTAKTANIKITLNTGPQGLKTFESSEINKLIETHCNGHTPRQVAMFIRNDIFRVAKHFKITGNAHKYLTKNLNNYLYYETPSGTQIPIENSQYWSSDFQRDNPLCPEKIRKGLQIRYNTLFSG
jgi:hypothetical protein